MPIMSTHVGAVHLETPVPRGSLSMPAVECQSVQGAPRRRAAPGSQFLKVAAAAATSGRQRSTRSWAPSLWVCRARPFKHGAKHPPVPSARGCCSPRAKAQRLRTSHAASGVSASLHARHTWAAHCQANTRPALFASEHNGHVHSKYGASLRQEPNPSIERTFQRPLRALWPAAHVER